MHVICCSVTDAYSGSLQRTDSQYEPRYHHEWRHATTARARALGFLHGRTKKLSSSQPTTSPYRRTLSRVCSNAWFCLLSLHRAANRREFDMSSSECRDPPLQAPGNAIDTIAMPFGPSLNRRWRIPLLKMTGFIRHPDHQDQQSTPWQKGRTL
jgi:hypothetical protein